MTSCTVFAGGKSPWANHLPAQTLREQPEPLEPLAPRSQRAKGLGPDAKAVLLYLQRNQWSSVHEISVALAMTMQDVSNRIHSMRDTGRIIRDINPNPEPGRSKWVYATNPRCTMNSDI